MAGNHRWILAIAGLAIVAAPVRAEKVSTERIRSAASLVADGSLVIDNPIGPVIVVGTGQPNMRWEAIKAVRAVDIQALQEGRARTALAVGGDEKTRVLKTSLPYPLRNDRWQSVVSYRVEVPAGIRLTVVTVSGEQISITNIHGEVKVRNVNGRIILTSVGGPVHVDTVNGHITADLNTAISNDWRLSSVNGPIELRLHEGVAFNWVAETVRGGIYTTVPLEGRTKDQDGTKRFQAVVRRANTPVIHTAAMMSDTHLNAANETITSARALVPPPGGRPAPTTSVARGPEPLRPELHAAYQRVATTMLLRRPSARQFVTQQASVQGDLSLDAPLGSIFVGEVAGDANVATRAGEIVLGRVGGKGLLRSDGGSLHIGEVAGSLDARTSVGDIYVRHARRGGSASTEGGNIQVLRSGGAISLRSGGGDVILRNAGASVKAETRSGDVVIYVDPTLESETITAETKGGNVILFVPAGFKADVEAILETTPESGGSITSEIAGLAIVRETAGNKIRIRATGSLNSGGRKVVLKATDGTIQIRLLR
ncbi:MAG: hypothetical protein ABR517_14120 [Thermoanaerobaculia bacterium]